MRDGKKHRNCQKRIQCKNDDKVVDEKTVAGSAKTKIEAAVAKADCMQAESGTEEQYANAEFRLRIARSAYEIGDRVTALTQLDIARVIFEDYEEREDEEYKHPRAFELDAPHPTSFAVLLQEINATERIADVDEIILAIENNKDVDWGNYKIPQLQEEDFRIAVPHPNIDGFWLSNTGLFHKFNKKEKDE